MWTPRCGVFPSEFGSSAPPHPVGRACHRRAAACCPCWVAVVWSLSRRQQNRLQHALNGNPVDPGGASSWRPAGRRGLTARELMEPLAASKLRAMGWVLPPDVRDDYVFRVYDTRLDVQWFRGLLPELGLEAGTPCMIGGDFVQPPYREDAVALQSGKLQRWGPPGSTPYHLVVPPRPHLQVWFQRAHQQLSHEAPATWVTVCCVVPRDQCAQHWDLSAVRRAAPQAETILTDPALEVRVAAVGERPLIVRVPAHVQELPPPSWEGGLLARNRVLLCISFRRRAEGVERTFSGGWIRGALPPPPTEDLELLRLEYILPPATRAAGAERALRQAVRKLAGAMGQLEPAATQLRQVQVAHGAVFALLGVPRPTARTWLRGSGCGGLYIRPFWTASSGPEVARHHFTLLWARGQLEKGAKLWEAVHDQPGVFGLVADGKDLAVRVTGEAQLESLQSQLRFVLDNQGAQFRRAEPGLRWWRLGPLSDAELWRVKDLIAQTGLQLARAELRMARMGPFRSAVFFPATGQPTVTTLDDGSWDGCEARLQQAEPPPRRRPAGPALAPQSTWAGPRAPQPTEDFGFGPAAASSSQRPVSAPSTPAPATHPAGGGRGQGRGRGRGRATGSSAPPQALAATSPAPPAPQLGDLQTKLDNVLRQVENLSQQNNSLLEELRELRRENATLRRQLDEARRTVHQPYAPVVPASSSTVPPPALAPDLDGLMALDSPERPVLRRPTARALTSEDDPAHGF